MSELKPEQFTFLASVQKILELCEKGENREEIVQEMTKISNTMQDVHDIVAKYPGIDLSKNEQQDILEKSKSSLESKLQELKGYGQEPLLQQPPALPKEE